MKSYKDNIDLRLNVPAIFATSQVEQASDRYTFIPTTRLLDDMEKMGWFVERGNQQKSKDPDHTKHEVFLRHGDYPAFEGIYPEIRVVNSHNRLASFAFYVGLYRMVCSNGLIVADKVFEELHLRHIGYEFSDVLALVGTIVQNIKGIQNSVFQMQNRSISKADEFTFALRAIAKRYPEYVDEENGWVNSLAIQNAIDMDEFLAPLRDEDKNNDVWTIYNKVQEKLMKGGFKRVGTKDNIAKLVRPVKNIKLDIDLNKSLWELAKSFAK